MTDLAFISKLERVTIGRGGLALAWHRPWHQGNGWRDIGYHWIIDRDGTLAPGRTDTEMGAHVAGRTSGTPGICLPGGHGSPETSLHPRARCGPAPSDRRDRQALRLQLFSSSRCRNGPTGGQRQGPAFVCRK